MDNDVKQNVSDRIFDNKKLQGREKIIINVSQEQVESNPFEVFSNNIGVITDIMEKNTQ